MSILINILWLFCAVFNIAALYHFVFVTNKGSTPNYPWLAFFTFFAAFFGPVWTVGLIVYRLGE